MNLPDINGLQSINYKGMAPRGNLFSRFSHEAVLEVLKKQRTLAGDAS
jgi:hypothetical protein